MDRKMTTRRNEFRGLQITLYYCQGGFMLLAPSFILDRSRNPYGRIAATLFFAMRSPFTLETEEGLYRQAKGILAAPGIARRRVNAPGSDIVICDFGVTTPQYRALSMLLKSKSTVEFSPIVMNSVATEFVGALTDQPDSDKMTSLISRIIATMTNQESEPPPLDPRVTATLRLIDQLPANVISLDQMAKHVDLSTSRLRHLFREQTDVSLTQYLRWTAMWKAIWLWSPQNPFEKIVETVGFHDLSHFNRTFNEAFGINPSTVAYSKKVQLIRCALN